MHPVCVVLRAALHWNGIPRPGKVHGHRPRHLLAPHCPDKLVLHHQPNGKRAAPWFSAMVPTYILYEPAEMEVRFDMCKKPADKTKQRATQTHPDACHAGHTTSPKKSWSPPFCAVLPWCWSARSLMENGRRTAELPPHKPPMIGTLWFSASAMAWKPTLDRIQSSIAERSRQVKSLSKSRTA